MRKKESTHKNLLLFIAIFCLMQLVACTLTKNKFDVSDDSTPPFDVDIARIPDAVPKKEPLSPYGNKPYKIGSKKYKVLKDAKGYNEKGMASWYGSKFHNRLTSTRERYNMFAMTAASTKLPLPTYVKVTNLENDKEVIVKVNDRGPFKKNRIIDLSFAAAKKLDFIDQGVTKVRVVAIDPDKWHKGSKLS